MNALERFRRRCRWLRVLATWTFAGTAAVLLLAYLVLPMAYLTSRSPLAAADGRYLLLALVQMSPGIGYLWALWAARVALGELAAGRLFQVAVARALRRIGYGVIVGALLSIFAVTNLSRLIQHGHGGYAYFDISGIVLAVVGVALIVLAQLVDQARALQQEMDEII